MAAVPSMRVTWKMIGMLVDGNFRDLVDDIMHDVKVVSPPTDYAQIWTAPMTEELVSVYANVRFPPKAAICGGMARACG